MASRFWVGGTGTWDSSTTTHWSDSSGGSGGFSVPGAGDTVTFDGASGGGTVTLNFGGTITITSLAMGAFTGTFDNSVNNNNITINGTGNAFNISGSGTRTINLGTATYTINGTSGGFNASTVTNLTLSAASATIVLAGTNATRSFNGGGKSYGTVTFDAIGTFSNSGRVQVTGANTIGTLNINAPNFIEFTSGVTQTVTTMNVNGTSSNQVGLVSDSNASNATIAVTTLTCTYASFRALTFTGSPTATNSFNIGANTGITINAPSGGGAASARVIGG